ncbi:MAG: ABC transporter permease [Candidatus Korobacteraceae bacterium]
MLTLLQDIRYAFRQLRRSPGFALTAIITLALGIGANTAIFTLVHAVMLKSLPVANPKQLYRIGDNDNCCVMGGFQEKGWGVFSYALYQYLRDNTPQFEEMSAFQANEPDFNVRRSGVNAAAEPIPGEFVSGNYFSTFGIQPFAGRMLTARDDTPSATPVAVMTYRAWQQHYGLDPSVIGATFMIDGKPFTIAGVTPPGFFGDRLRDDPPEFFVPLASEPLLNSRDSLLNVRNEHWLYLIGRLRPNTQPAQVEAQLIGELRQWLPNEASSLPQFEREKIPKAFLKLGPGGAGVTDLRDTSEAGLYLLLAASALVLLIACANLANLLMARGTARRQQTAVQLALGATRGRLVRALLTESILLSCIGGAAGLALAYFGSRAILLIAFRGSRFIPIDTTPSLPILTFACVLSVITGVIFGVAPAWISSHSDPAEALRGANRATRDRSALPQRSLVIAQVAFSLVLLALAGLVTESLRNMENVHFGFETGGRLIVNLDPLMAGYKPEQLPVLYQQLRERIGQIPGVKSVSYSMYTPQDGDNWDDEIQIQGRSRESTQDISVEWLRVSPDYFKTIGTPILRGRAIGEQDTPTSQHVAVVDEAFVRKFFPNEDPMGKHFGFSQDGHSGDYEIVGVARDTRYRDLTTKQQAMFFLPFFQTSHFDEPSYQRSEVQSQYIADIELHYAGTLENIGPQVRSVLASIDPNLSIIEMRSFGEQVSRRFNQERLIARLTELFGLLALLLASIGLYGVTAYNIARRTSEIGIRMALGANRQDVVAMVLRGAFWQIGVGLVIGIPLALAAGRAIASKLYGMSAFSPIVMGVAIVLLAFCAFIAGLVPGWRAASIEPVEALRTE